MTFNQQQFQECLVNISNLNLEKIPLYYYQITDSTNQQLWQLIDQKIETPLVAIASQQTAGRGQWGRQWLSALGGLYLSLAITPNIPANYASHLTICSAYGVGKILRNYDLPIGLKWPNDLFLENLKLGGIKTETRIYQGKIQQAVIGIGINWSNPVPETGINLESFLKRQQKPSINSLEMLAAITLTGLWQGYQDYLSQGIEIILPEYLGLLNQRYLKAENLDSLRKFLTEMGINKL